MSTHKVLFLPYNREIEVQDGEILIRAAMEAGVHINASCGGEGVCGKCRIIIEKGSVEEGISEKLSREDLGKGYRLACKAIIREDIIVRIPVESEVDASVLNFQISARKTASIEQPDFSQLKEQGLFIPPVEKKYLELPQPTVQDNMPDTSRLINYLKINHDEHRLVAELPLVRKLPDVLRENDFKVTATLARPVQKGRKTHIINIDPGDTTERNYALAVDIGTTTVYGELIDLNTGKTLSEAGDFNGQISYGEDVITRIMYAEKPEGLVKIHEVIIGTINKIINKIIRKAKVERDEISSITLAGNTTMTQLFLKVNPRYIRRAPYVPTSTIYSPVSAVSIGLDLGDHVEALVYPQISSYVGGDIVAGVMGSGMHLGEELTLFMDIGTNAEIVVGNKEWLACAACSAGPAFEGGGVRWGMRAEEGAIEKIHLDSETLEPDISVVGNVLPRGICGSGMIDLISEMLLKGIIDQKGKFKAAGNHPQIIQDENGAGFVVAFADKTAMGKNIIFSEPDIDNIIRSKGAVYAGFTVLLKQAGLDFSMVEEIIIAGGFGQYLDIEKAITIGFLPDIERSKFKYLGNSSIAGSYMALLSKKYREEAVQISNSMTYIDFSSNNEFMNEFTSALFLPHTNMNDFPSVNPK